MIKQTIKRTVCSLLSCILILSGMLGAPAAAAQDSVDEDDLLAGIVAFKLQECGAQSIQEWIDTSLAENAGISSETYILALHQSGVVYDYSSYSRALLAYIEQNSAPNASGRLKYALALLSANCRSEYTAAAVSDSIGRLGVASWIYGLHLLNNGCGSAAYTAQEVIDTVLSLQLADGGWAVSGEVSDVDVTAMAVQALAPHRENEEIGRQIDAALELLSSRQLDSGAYSSYGVENAESTAQVIIALCALGIDCRTDSRFVKNGCSPMDGIRQFRKDNGSFAHIAGGEYSHMATAQTFAALTAVERLGNGLGSLYILDPQPDNTVEIAAESDPAEDASIHRTGGKILAVIAIAAAALIACAILFVLGKRNCKNYLVIAAAACLAAAVVLCTDISSPEDYYGTTISKTDVIGTVTVSIRCDTIAGADSAEHIPQDGVILEETEFELARNETVYDILIEAARKHSLHTETRDGTYVTGIGYICEFDHGELSGWLYRVNGEVSSVGCTDYVLSDGDRIEWLYSCDMGRDLDRYGEQA